MKIFGSRLFLDILSGFRLIRQNVFSGGPAGVVPVQGPLTTTVVIYWAPWNCYGLLNGMTWFVPFSVSIPPTHPPFLGRGEVKLLFRSYLENGIRYGIFVATRIVGSTNFVQCDFLISRTVFHLFAKMCFSEFLSRNKMQVHACARPNLLLGPTE